ncbi:TetR/AcrR family transcriptional regulator [Novosphingobium sp. 1949]|uniref:TetR/AcrR family transcriptional regulator n=1 Tax=Novosphingobium organovorum TaxID=2930092 RepID=A0ABT0BIS5_9SPHN|nr:TetR/AcrR family transcriptional regulator [Novosphingobium organovorum]MCJ2184868.1 TetR/AcrR family transcriptional regulator [Novosphingobium organovorum]
MKNYAVQVADLAFPMRQGGYAKGNETREAILRCALGILVEEGYRAMSMRRVATASGMKFGNLTYYFPTREDLVRELLEAVITAYERVFDELSERVEPDPRRRLAAYCSLILQDIRTKKTTRVFPELWALSSHDPFVLSRVQDLYRRAQVPLVGIVAEMRPDLSEPQREALVLFISFSMEGTTPFAGFGKPYEPRMPELEKVAVHAFLTLVETYRP